MRLVWVVSSLAWDSGTVIMKWVVPILSQIGITVDILPLYVTEPQESLMPIENAPGIEVLAAPVQGRWARNIQASGVLRRAFKLYDRVIVDQDLDTELKAVTAKTSVAKKTPLILISHLPLTEYLAARGENQIAGLRRLIDGLYPKMDRVVTITDAQATDLMEYHGVGANRIRRASLPLPFRAWQEEIGENAPHPFLDTDDPVIAVMGRLDALKGMEVLINALRVVKDHGYPVRLLVLGAGPLRASHEQLCRSLGVPAHFVGFAENPAAWIHRAKIFVAPQYFDGSGWDMHLAMSVGVPVIATNAPHASREVLAKGTLGKIVSIGEPMALAEGIERWLDNDRIRGNFSLLAKQRARALDRERVASAWIDALTN